jgi:hypothetical protein
MKQADVERLQAEAAEFLRKANIAFTEQERKSIEIADFGLNDVRNVGLEIVARCVPNTVILLSGRQTPESRRRFDAAGGRFTCTSKAGQQRIPKRLFRRNTRNTCRSGMRLCSNPVISTLSSPTRSIGFKRAIGGPSCQSSHQPASTNWMCSQTQISRECRRSVS